jgi:hypothetical protein
VWRSTVIFSARANSAAHAASAAGQVTAAVAAAWGAQLVAGEGNCVATAGSDDGGAATVSASTMIDTATPGAGGVSYVDAAFATYRDAARAAGLSRVVLGAQQVEIA